MSLDTLYRKPTPPFSWYPVNEVWTYASAAAPTFTLTIPGDQSMKYWPGQRVRLTQTTVKYFIITKAAYSAPDTTLTLYGGTDYALANAAITAPAFSMDKCPMGFPLDPALWTVISESNSSFTKATPAATVWYSVSSLYITIPIGVWDVSYQVIAAATKGSAADLDAYTTLTVTDVGAGDAAIAEDTDWTAIAFGYGTQVLGSNYRKKSLTLDTADVYYLVTKTAQASLTSVRNYGSLGATIISATCAYL